MIERIFGRGKQVAENRDFMAEKSEYGNLTPVELLKKGIETERMENIPVNLIYLDEGIVDENHVGNLAESINGSRGQISPITLRAHYVNREVRYDVIDGFHRSHALARLGEEPAKAVVVYGCSDEELFDLRVLAANSVKSIQFARVAEWMQYSFSQSEWAKRGLTLSQVFSLVLTDDPGLRIGLTVNESAEAKKWARDKAKLWQKGIASIWQTARAIEVASPELVSSVRSGGKGELNPAKFKSIVFALQGEYELQRRVSEVAVEHSLTGKEAEKFAKAVAQAKEDSEKVSAILGTPWAYIGKGDFQKRISSIRPEFLAEKQEYANLTSLQLLEQEIRTERIELIPVGTIVLDAAIVDDRHVNSLARSISGPRGQISPMTLRARDAGDGKIHYDVIDGFHRAYALNVLNRDTAKSVVLYGCSDEELFDLRVLATNSVRSVEFARVARWMQHSFAQTEWHRKGLSLSQIFAFEVMDTSVASRLGLNREETKEARRWVREKAEIWQRPVSTIWETMRAVDAAAPDLVHNVRVGGGGRKSKRGELSPARFKAIVYPLAGEHQLQRDVVVVVSRENLTSESAGALARAVARVKDDPEKVKTILRDPNSALGWDYIPRGVADSSLRVEVPSRGPAEELNLEQEVTRVVAEYAFDLEEEAQLKSLVESAKQHGKQRSLELILSDPRFFIGERQKSASEITEPSESVQGENDVFFEETGERAEPEPMIVTPDTFKPRRKTIAELEQRLENYQEIIKRQDMRIKRLEAELARTSPLEEFYPTKTILLQRPWGDVEFNSITGEVGSKEIGFIELTQKERTILGTLVRYGGTPLDYRTIVLLTSEDEFIPGDVDVLWSYISRIRRKLKDVSPLLVDKLKHVSGYGYEWK